MNMLELFASLAGEFQGVTVKIQTSTNSIFAASGLPGS